MPKHLEHVQPRALVSLHLQPDLDQIQRVGEARRKAARATSEPEGIMYGRLLHILALPQLGRAHLLLKSRHDFPDLCRSCM